LDGLGALAQLGADRAEAEIAQVAPHAVRAVQRNALLATCMAKSFPNSYGVF
jgi:hypothetical protein